MNFCERDRQRRRTLPVLCLKENTMKKTTLALCALLLVSCLLAPGAFAEETYLTLPAALTAIEDEAFRGCGATCVFIPDGVTTIGALTFADCAALEEIHIPASVTSIADDAFNGHSSALTIYSSEKSAAKEHAQKHGIKFTIENSGEILLPDI